MKLTQEEGRKIVYGDSDEWSEVSGTRHIIEHTRWSVISEAVFLHKASGKHYSLFWGQGATESQEERAFEYDEPKPTEVQSVEVVVRKWVPVHAAAPVPSAAQPPQ